MKTAIVGLGVIGKVHEKVLETLSIPAACACDILESEILRYGEKGYQNYSKMLEEEKPQVVHICTPHYLHAEMIIEALERGIHVLCEKPICIQKEEIENILEAEKRSSAQLGVCFQNRYNPSTLLAKELLSGKKIRSAEGSVRWHRDAAYYAQAQWRGKKRTEGGGVLVNQAIHTLDLLQLFCGMPSKVIATCENRSLQGVIEVEDTVNMTCMGKVNFSLFATNAEVNERPAEIRFIMEEGEVVRLLPSGVFVG
ncbi:MAG: Gfo/Idh/MocA family oxidoreductase, partial [Clostridia bacterium]|nr:Gfo/Idh/MocA family oxidoreductase [Clostridia bacterium]